MMGYSPHYLMFGCRPRLPVDFYFATFRSAEVPMRGTSAKCVDEYVATVCDQLRATLWEAQAQSTAEAQWQKWYYNWKIGAMDLKPGDLVLVKVMPFRERGKLKTGGRTSLMRWCVRSWQTSPYTKWQTNMGSNTSYTATNSSSLHQKLVSPHVWVSVKHGTDVPATPQSSPLLGEWQQDYTTRR